MSIFSFAVTIVDVGAIQDNVLVSADGQPQICDFGISTILATSTTFGATSSHTYGTRGSLRWMAIEFFESVDTPILHSEKTDVWAFGMTAYVRLYPFSIHKPSLLTSPIGTYC